MNMTPHHRDHQQLRAPSMPGIDNVCTVQPQYMALPAGMLDGNGDFGGAMARDGGRDWY